MLLRIRVLRGRIDAVTAALAAREDVPLIDLSAGGDQLSAILLADPEEGNRLVFRQLPATSAVTSVDAEAVLHVFADASDWRLDVLTAEERSQFTPTHVPEHPSGRDDPDALGTFSPLGGEGGPGGLDDLDRTIITLVEPDARTTASAIARSTGQPESTVRRRLAGLFDQGRLTTQVVVDPRRLGLGVDANLRMQVLPKHLDAIGRALAAHPAVHGALATTGAANLYLAVWLKDLDHLYRFITRDLAEFEIGHVDTVLVGRRVKRPGQVLPPAV
jgi:DNA-binding Lrp family transcriptional regulator